MLGAVVWLYAREDDGELRFRPLPKPSPEQVAQIARWTYEGICRVLARQGRSLDGFDEVVDEFVGTGAGVPCVNGSARAELAHVCEWRRWATELGSCDDDYR